MVEAESAFFEKDTHVQIFETVLFVAKLVLFTHMPTIRAFPCRVFFFFRVFDSANEGACSFIFSCLKFLIKCRPCDTRTKTEISFFFFFFAFCLLQSTLRQKPAISSGY